MRVFIYKSAKVAKLKSVNVHFGGGMAFVGVSHFRFGDGWASLEQSNSNLNSSMYAASAKKLGTWFTDKKGPFTSPYEAQAGVLLNDGANVFRVRF